MNAKLTKIIGTAIVIGGLTIAPLVYWNGEAILTGVQTRFNDLQTAFRNATNSITNYKTVLAQKNATLEQYRTLHTQLNDELKQKDSTISDLNKQIDELKASGSTSSAEVERLQGELDKANKDKQDLQGQIDNLQSQIDEITEAIKDIDTGEGNENSLTAKIQALLTNYNLALEQIGKANTDATNLDNNTQYTVNQDVFDKYKNGVDSVEDITKGEGTETLYLSYQLIEKSNTGDGKVGKLVDYLDNYKDVDAHRESPILLYHKYNVTVVTGGKSYYTVKMNNTTAYNSIKAHTSDWTVYTDSSDNEYLLSKDSTLDGGTKNNMGIAIQLVDNDEWTNQTDLESDNHN